MSQKDGTAALGDRLHLFYNHRDVRGEKSPHCVEGRGFAFWCSSVEVVGVRHSEQGKEDNCEDRHLGHRCECLVNESGIIIGDMNRFSDLNSSRATTTLSLPLCGTDVVSFSSPSSHPHFDIEGSNDISNENNWFVISTR